ncbi:hypothetical protein D9C73_004662 [Collichthys lucidus]|uniref:Uncharacterized protein n=1 Tax=Collichthys lucidus TaxID=240159 RepID=A0A4U5UBM1_COLLU|nr:hypothetical protein D9C73_004662 [Collichthys lucidus]
MCYLETRFDKLQPMGEEIRSQADESNRGKLTGHEATLETMQPKLEDMEDRSIGIGLVNTDSHPLKDGVGSGVMDYQEEEEEVTRLSSFYRHNGRGAESEEDADGGS